MRRRTLILVMSAAACGCAALREAAPAESDGGADSHHDDGGHTAPSGDAAGAATPNDADTIPVDDGPPPAPVVIASGQNHPYDLAVEGTRIYFTVRNDSAASVKAVNTDGTDLVVLAPFDSTSGLNPLAADLELAGNDVLWVNETAGSGAIFRVPKIGGAVTAAQPSLDTPHGLGALGTTIVWSDKRFTPAVYPLMRADTPSGTARVAAGGQIRLGGIAIDPTGIYWTAGGALANGKAAVRSLGLGDAGAVDLYVGDAPSEIGGIAVGATDVFWADTEGNRVMMVSKNGGKATVLADAQAAPMRVAFDGTYVYFTNCGLGTEKDGSVMKVALDGSAPRAIATGQDHPLGLTLDGTYVYWTNYAGGELVRARK